MAGIFGFFDYTKEGPGVDPDAPKKGAVATFFSVLGRKFWKLISINLLYIITNIPALIVAFFVSTIVTQVLLPGLTLENLNDLWDPSILGEGVDADQLSATVILVLNFLVAALSVGLGFIVVGPSQAGVTFILRNYSREEHAFVWSDFIDHAKKNWKQSTVVCLISTVLFLAIPVAINFYAQAVGNALFRTLLTTLLIIIFVTFSVMLMYVYQMMVTFNLSVKQMLKNAWLFFILRLPFNLGILLLQLLIIAVIPGALMLFLGSIGIIVNIFYFGLFAFAINLLLVNFFINRQLYRFMIKPLTGEEDEEEEEYEYDYDYDVETDDEEVEDEEEDLGESYADGETSPAY